jgi:hypothetical protein
MGGSRPQFPEEIRTRIARGARLVRFEFCVSFLVFTVRRQSPIFITESWQGRYIRGLGYSLLALLLGPWGIPWGPIWSTWAVWVNLTGGVDETDTVLALLDGRTQPVPSSENAVPAIGNPTSA